ncbi:MAG: alpha/beta hydrolase [Betaproteobacteria bacterium]|nr:MAG: alpha/beta hydrolase [Betaproteobacteria bacterium]
MVNRRSLAIALAALLCFVAGSARADTTTSLAPASGDGTFVQVYGARIHYVEAGSGPVVILLHGLADDVGVWKATLEALSRRYRVIALDQIGFGKSDKPLLKIDRASFVGNSLGGWVAAAYALAHSERVDRLALVDSAGYAALGRSLGPDMFNALHLRSRADFRRLAPLTFYDRRFYQDDPGDSLLAERVKIGDGYTIDRFLDSMARGEDVLDHRLRRLRRPTLIVWGRDDGLIPLSFGRRFQRDIAGSKLVVIDKCGHMPQVECAQDLDGALLRFLDGGDAVR